MGSACQENCRKPVTEQSIRLNNQSSVEEKIIIKKITKSQTLNNLIVIRSMSDLIKESCSSC